MRRLKLASNADYLVKFAMAVWFLCLNLLSGRTGHLLGSKPYVQRAVKAKREGLSVFKQLLFKRQLLRLKPNYSRKIDGKTKPLGVGRDGKYRFSKLAASYSANGHT